jgi:hypothetical protein
MVVAICLAIVAMALFLQTSGRKHTIDRDEMRRMRRYSETIHREEAQPFE